MYRLGREWAETISSRSVPVPELQHFGERPALGPLSENEAAIVTAETERIAHDATQRTVFVGEKDVAMDIRIELLRMRRACYHTLS
jgi:hypothetical protein